MGFNPTTKYELYNLKNIFYINMSLILLIKYIYYIYIIIFNILYILNNIFKKIEIYNNIIKNNNNFTLSIIKIDFK